MNFKDLSYFILFLLVQCPPPSPPTNNGCKLPRLAELLLEYCFCNISDMCPEASESQSETHVKKTRTETEGVSSSAGRSFILKMF